MNDKRRVALVTGGMGGIGTAICRRLSAAGHVVIAGCGPGSPRRERWLAEMRAEGHEVYSAAGNVADWDSTRTAIEREFHVRHDARTRLEVRRRILGVDAALDGMAAHAHVHLRQAGAQAGFPDQSVSSHVREYSTDAMYQ